MLFLGVALKRVGWINDNFIHTASALVFNVTMPALLFLGILHADLRAALQPKVLGYFTLATLISFALAWGWAIWRCPREDRGIYTQGAFRGNNGVIGLALAASMYGDYGISLGAVLAGLVILLYNTLSTIVLAVYSPVIKSDPWSVCKSVVKNPLIISVLVALTLNDNLTLPGNIGWLDYDPVCDCQDFGDLVLESVAITQTDADHADAVVRFRIFKDDKEKTTQTLKMVAENGRWVIDDIVSNHGSVLQAVNSENEKTLAALASLQKEQPEAFVAELFEHIADYWCGRGRGG